MDGLLWAIEYLEKQIEWDVLLLQELARTGEVWPTTAESKLNGHRLVLSEEKPEDVAVLIHRRFWGN